MRALLTATPKNYGPVTRTEVPPQPLGPALTPSRAPESTASHDDTRDRRLTVLRPSASAVHGAGITKAFPTDARLVGEAFALAFGLAFAFAFSFAIPFARLSSSTVAWFMCGNGHLSPCLQSPFKKKRQ